MPGSVVLEIKIRFKICMYKVSIKTIFLFDEQKLNLKSCLAVISRRTFGSIFYIEMKTKKFF